MDLETRRAENRLLHRIWLAGWAAALVYNVTNFPPIQHIVYPGRSWGYWSFNFTDVLTMLAIAAAPTVIAWVRRK